MAAGEVRRRAGMAVSALDAVAGAVAHPLRAASAVGEGLAGLGDTLGAAMHRVSATPFNTEIGPHRRFDWLRYDLEEVKEVKNRLGATVNDVVLANVAGAMRSFLIERGEDVSDLTFRAAVPVNVRTEADEGRLGNRVSSLIVELPLAEPDPWQRLRRVVETTSDLKSSGESKAVDLIGKVADLMPPGAMTAISRASNRAVNMIVTNVPGPRVPIYMLTAPMLASYPVVPLMSKQALNIAIFSYRDALLLGFLADWDAVPDLHLLVQYVSAELEALERAGVAEGHAEARSS